MNTSKNDTTHLSTGTNTSSMPSHYAQKTPDEAHDDVKQTVASAVATVAGAIDGFLETMKRYDVPTQTKRAMEQLGQATRQLTSTTADEVKETSSTLRQGGTGDTSDTKTGGQSEQSRQTSTPDLPGTQAPTAEMTAGRGGGQTMTASTGSSGSEGGGDTGRGTRIQNTGPEGTRNTMGPRAYPGSSRPAERQTDSYSEADKDLNADRKFHKDSGWDDQDTGEHAATGSDEGNSREDLPSRAVH